MHNCELAKKYQVSCTLTRKDCPAKLGVTWPTCQANVFHLVENFAALWDWSKLRQIRLLTNQCIQNRYKVSKC